MKEGLSLPRVLYCIHEMKLLMHRRVGEFIIQPWIRFVLQTAIPLSDHNDTILDGQ